jgi:hypothetical protein
MNDAGKNTKIRLPNLLLIAGNGRNVGKTTLACQIISHFAKKKPVTAVKISPHFHAFDADELVFSTENFVILNETKLTEKDSSRMLQAGASKVFFVMAKPGFLNDATEKLLQFLTENLIVCESGGLHEFVTPAIFLMVKRTGDEIVKKHLLNYAPIIVNNDGKNFDFDFRRFGFNNNKISLKP